MLESVKGLVSAGWRVVVCAPADGPLASQVRDLGAETSLLAFPVLKRADKSPAGMLKLAWSAAAALPRMMRLVRSLAPDVCYVNTVTLPWWLVAGRARPATAVVCHVHEAEPDQRWAVRAAMTFPLLLASAVIVNSQATGEALWDTVRRLRPRTRLVHNGVDGPDQEPLPPMRGASTRIVCVGRLSDIKGTDLALEATAALVAEGYDVTLDLCGTVVPGKEAFFEALRARAAQPDLAGRVTFSGYVSPVWPSLARGDIFLTPARQDTFGNAVVEAQLALRPVVATAVQGHLETVLDGVTGLHVSCDPTDMARAVARLIDDPALADRLACQGRQRAVTEFSAERYRARIPSVLDEAAGAAPEKAAS
jgi:glycosyltransferase involved in cell wall biosynthesis